jgi:hypothetical protein
MLKALVLLSAQIYIHEFSLGWRPLGLLSAQIEVMRFLAHEVAGLCPKTWEKKRIGPSAF